MQSECPVCHTKIQRGQKCSKCVTVVDPNNPILQAGKKSVQKVTVKCEYCNQDILLENFDDHDNDCEIKKTIQGYYQEEIQEREQFGQERQRPRQQQQQNQFSHQRDARDRIWEQQMQQRHQRALQRQQGRPEHLRLDGIHQNAIEEGLPIGNGLRIVFMRRGENGEHDIEEPVFLNAGNIFRGLHLYRHHPEQQQRVVKENQLIKIKYKPSQQLSEENKKCMICLSDYEVDQELILLQCAHRFHSDCIKDWLKKQAKCPVCRHNLEQ